MLIESLLTRYLRRTNQNHLNFDITDSIDFPEPLDRKYLLYIHVPFCEVLCPFCSFHRVKLNDQKANPYFRALRKEIKTYHDRGYDFSSVYVGGGTPTVMPQELAETLQLVRSLFSVRQISIETNPDHLNDQVISVLKSVGVNRVSVGIQSFDDRLLKEMERYGKYGSGAEITEKMQEAQGQFDTLNADMIFNIPHQTMASLEHDIQTVTETIKVDQASFYPLMESSTTERAMSLKMGAVNHTREKEYYSNIVKGMSKDYNRSTAWCFSRHDTMIDEYIVDEDEYVGVGSGAFSYINGVTYSGTFSINRYVELLTNGKLAITAQKRFSAYERMRYDLLMNLFGLVLNKQAIESKYHGDFSHMMWKEFLALKLLGAIKDEGDHYRLTEKGVYYWVVMMREFFVGVNNFREQMRSRIKSERDRDAFPDEIPLQSLH